jgi:hypothetical protein
VRVWQPRAGTPVVRAVHVSSRARAFSLACAPAVPSACACVLSLSCLHEPALPWQDRKVMLKTLKPNVVELSKHEQGHLVLLRALDVVDDTVCSVCVCLSLLCVCVFSVLFVCDSRVWH